MISFLLLYLYLGIAHYKNKTIKKIFLYIGVGLFAFLFYKINPYAISYYLYVLLICLFILHAYEEKTSKLSCCLFITGIGWLAYLSTITSLYDSLGLLADFFYIGIVYHDASLKYVFENNSASFQTKLLKNQIDEVHNIYMTMRGWRHDYHNHLQSLKAKLSKNQIQEAITYLNELEIDLDDIQQVVETGNIQIDAILNSKLSLAINHDIDLNVKVLIPEHLPFSEIDCCVILGNLIDNAIESCEKVEDHKFIRLYIGLYKKQFYISITNATTELVRKLDEEYITHKRGNHGHGLKRINLIVEKYNGYINRKNEPGIFVTEIMLPMNQTCTK